MTDDPQLSGDVQDVRDDEAMDWDALDEWLRREVPGLSGPMQVGQFHGGHANLTYCVSYGDMELVVRRPPHGKVAPGAHDMAREAKVLRGLRGHFEKAPHVYAFCDDEEVIGAPFIVMQRCHGVIVREEVPACLGRDLATLQQLSFGLVDAIAELQRIDIHKLGFGNPVRAMEFTKRQLDGWRQRWRLSTDDQHDEAFDATFEALSRTLPATEKVTVVHNDLKLDNCMFDPADPSEVAFILDWDMTTLGDPMVEFGTLLGYWREKGDTFNRAPTVELDMDKFPSRLDLVERYLARGGSARNLGWYEAFAVWKHAVVLQQLYQRYAKGESQDQRYAAFREHVPQLIEGASGILRDKRSYD